jgi:hypothetical protein
MPQRKKLPRGIPPSQRPDKQGAAESKSSSEKTFNLFLFVDGDVVIQLGVCCHEQEGSDSHKLSFLQARVKADLAAATRFPLPDRYQLIRPGGSKTTGLRYESYMQLSQLGRHIELFEEIFSHFGASANPLMCITPVVDGTPRINAVMQF